MTQITGGASSTLMQEIAQGTSLSTSLKKRNS